jgi:hypothetical protein
VAWIFGHRPKRQKRTPVIFALNLPPGAKHPVFKQEQKSRIGKTGFTSFYSATLWRHAKVDINPKRAIVPEKLGFSDHHEVHEEHKEKNLTNLYRTS